jgi:hypothetical protein
MNLVTYDDVQKVLTGHEDEGSSFEQDGYPYGRQTTLRRVWVETATKGAKKAQQRFMAQTQNPKTFRWNKPKASTYSDIIILYLDSNEHVKLAHLSTWDSAEQIAAFVVTFGDYLTEHQRKNIRYLDAVRRVGSRITWTISEGGKETAQEHEKREKDERKMLNAMLVQELRSPSSPPVLA